VDRAGRTRRRTGSPVPDPAAFDRVLRLVADGRLTAEEAGPILDALDGTSEAADETAAAQAAGAPARTLRVEVTEAGRTVINLRIPLSLGRAAISQVPGISEATSDRIREAIAAGIKGPIVEVDDEGDGVRISIE
jgi:hypothetical protein